MSRLFSGAGLAIASFLLLASTTVDAATPTSYTCPPADSSTVITTEGLDSTSFSITVANTLAKNELCTLIRRDATTRKQRAPVARSYAGNPWEKSAGVFAKSGSGLVVDCENAVEGTTCDLTLPALEEGMEYVLESFVHEVSAEVEAARFLEQVSLVLHLC